LPNDRELFLAVNYDDLTSVEQALDNGGNPNFIHPKFGWTSIHHAAKMGYAEVIKALLSRNIAEPNIKDKFGNSPLHYAMKNGHEEIVEFISSLSQNYDEDISTKSIVSFKKYNRDSDNGKFDMEEKYQSYVHELAISIIV